MRTSVMQNGSYDAERTVQRCWRGNEDECNAEGELRCRRDSSTMLERGYEDECNAERELRRRKDSSTMLERI